MKNTQSLPTQKNVEETDNKQLILREQYRDTAIEVVGKLKDDNETYEWFAGLAGQKITGNLASKQEVINRLSMIDFELLIPTIAVITEAIINNKESNGNN